MLGTITEEVLKEQDNLVLTFPRTTSRSQTEIDVRAFRVGLTNWIYREYENLPYMKAGGTLSEDKLGENGHNSDVSNPGDSIFRIRDDSPLYMYHFAFGMKPDGFRITVENPAGSIEDGLLYATSASVGDNYGYYPSELMGYDDPTLVSEQFKIHDVTMHVGIENDNSVGHQPMLNMVGKGYELYPIEDEELIMDFISRKKPATIKTFGAYISSGASVPKEWQEPMTIGRDDLVRNIKGGRR